MSMALSSSGWRVRRKTFWILGFPGIYLWSLASISDLATACPRTQPVPVPAHQSQGIKAKHGIEQNYTNRTERRAVRCRRMTAALVEAFSAPELKEASTCQFEKAWRTGPGRSLTRSHAPLCGCVLDAVVPTVSCGLRQTHAVAVSCR
jgi:hypothetical protein